MITCPYIGVSKENKSITYEHKTVTFSSSTSNWPNNIIRVSENSGKHLITHVYSKLNVMDNAEAVKGQDVFMLQ